MSNRSKPHKITCCAMGLVGGGGLIGSCVRSIDFPKQLSPPMQKNGGCCSLVVVQVFVVLPFTVVIVQVVQVWTRTPFSVVVVQVFVVLVVGVGLGDGLGVGVG